MRAYEPYIPQTVGELVDQAGGMVLSAPLFIDTLGDWPEQCLETEFLALSAGLENVRRRVGEERYRQASDLIARMRPLFEADPEDVNGKTTEGRFLLQDLIDLLTKRRKGASAGGAVPPAA